MNGKEFFQELKETKKGLLKVVLETNGEYGIIEKLKKSKNPTKTLKKYLGELTNKQLKKIGFVKFASHFYFFPVKLALILKTDPKLSEKIKLEHFKGEKKKLQDIFPDELCHYGISIYRKYQIKFILRTEESLIEDDIDCEEGAEEAAIDSEIEAIEDAVKNDIVNFVNNEKLFNNSNEICVDILNDHEISIKLVSIPVKSRKKIKKVVKKLESGFDTYSLGLVKFQVKKTKIKEHTQ